MFISVDKYFSNHLALITQKMEISCTAVILGKLASPFLLLLHETLSPLSQMDLLSFPKERQCKPIYYSRSVIMGNRRALVKDVQTHYN